MIDIAKLRDARLAIMAGRVELADEILTLFQASSTGAPRSKSDLQQMGDELGQIRTLCAAMRDGIALAREQVRGIFGTARRLQTYDRSGTRHIETSCPSEVGRF